MRVLLPMIVMAFGAATALAGPPGGPSFQVSQVEALQARPAIAHDPGRDRFFSTWHDFRNKATTGLDIYGRIVDGRGQAVTGDTPVARSRGSQGFSAVAFDPVNERYLVVWTDWRDAADVDSDIYGRFINADGSPHGDEFRVSATRGISQKFPNLAFDPGRQRFLVLWVDARNAQVDKLYGRYLDVNGNLLGEEFPVALEGNYQDYPSLLFDPRHDRFVVVWRDTRSIAIDRLEKAVYGRFIDAVQGPSGTTFRIALEKEGCSPLSLRAVSYAPGDDAYFVAWSSGRNYSEILPSTGGYRDRQRGLDVYGAFISVEDGSLRKPPFPIASEIDYQEVPSVSYDPGSNRFLVVWYDLRRPPTGRDSDIYGRFVAPTGEMSDEFLVSENQAIGTRKYPTVAFSPQSRSFLVLWEDGRGRDTGRARQIYGAVR